jgi:hypothetical protein
MHFLPECVLGKANIQGKLEIGKAFLAQII